MMKILLFIDSLGSGGAQRQMVLLANGLSEIGHDVTILTYHNINHYKSMYNGLYPIVCLPKKRRFGFLFLFDILDFINEKEFQVIISYLFIPSFYILILKAFIKGKINLIISERAFEGATNFFHRKVIRSLYHRADYIVANSITQTQILKILLKSLNSRIVYIPNGIDFDHYAFKKREKSKIVKFIAVGSVYKLKNTDVLIEACGKLLKDGYVFSVTWVGRYNERDPYFISCCEKIDYFKLNNLWNWEGESEEVKEHLYSSDFLVHPSEGEGFSNVICEALACGLPPIVSNVCDNPQIIKHGQNGYLFNLNETDSLLQILKEAMFLTQDKYGDLMINARKTAVKNFSINSFINTYQNLIFNNFNKNVI